MRLHRLIAILLLIESRGRMKANDLALALETSARSIYRDIDVLAEAGIPIVSTPGPKGGISLMEGYTVNLKQLNGEEVINLYLTGMGIYVGGQSESGLKLKTALLKLEKILPASFQPDIQKAQSRFLFDDTPWWTESIQIPCLESVRKVVWRTQKLKIQYSKVSGETSVRTLQPYGLVVKQGDWYLIAYCEEAKQIRTFKCERIASTQLLDEEYTIPQIFSLEGHWREQEGVFKQTRKEDELYPVLIRINVRYKALLQRLEVLECMDEDAELKVTVNMYTFESACSNVWSIIDRADIVEPFELRQYVKHKLKILQEQYDK